MSQNEPTTLRRTSLAVITTVSDGKRYGRTSSITENKDPYMTLDMIPEESVIRTITVEDLYDKEKYDLSTMEYDDIFNLLE
jgi:hypothetical protein